MPFSVENCIGGFSYYNDMMSFRFCLFVLKNILVGVEARPRKEMRSNTTAGGTAWKLFPSTVCVFVQAVHLPKTSLPLPRLKLNYFSSRSRSNVISSKFSLISRQVISLPSKDFPGGLVAKPLLSQCRGPRSISDQGTRFHMPQLKDSLCHNQDLVQPNK